MLQARGEAAPRRHGFAQLASIYAQKLAAFLFVTNAEGNALELRLWRIASLVLASSASCGLRDRWLRRLLVGIVAYQVAVHIPVLYNHRYSVGALDLWLTLLAGVAQRSCGSAAGCGRSRQQASLSAWAPQPPRAMRRAAACRSPMSSPRPMPSYGNPASPPWKWTSPRSPRIRTGSTTSS
jgi:hypothetical protein